MSKSNRSCCGFVRRQDPATTEEPYQYDPLIHDDQIRILVLKPGKFRSPLVCELHTASLASKPVFEALSYTWGLEESTHALYAPKTIAIRPNLHAALQRLRFTDRPRKLWVDAVCINQSDTPERNSQIQLMKFIYAQAVKVIMWIGEASDNSNEAFKLIAPFENEEVEYISGNVNEAAFLARLGRPEDHLERWTALAKLLLRPYFKRTWIIQEAGLATSATVVCGDKTCSWNAISLLVQYIIHSKKDWYLGGNHTRWVLGIVAVRMSVQAPDDDADSKSFITLLVMTRGWDVTNPKDKIYGLLGLGSILESAFFNGLPIDYDSSCEDLYKSVAVQCLSLDPAGLKMLSWGGINEHSTLNLPSWVPDWTVSPDTRIGRDVLATKWFKAGGPLLPEYSISEDKRVISLQGRIFDTLQVVSESFMPNTTIASGSMDDILQNARAEIDRLREYKRMSEPCLPYVTEEAEGGWAALWPKLFLCNHGVSFGHSGPEPSSFFYRAAYRAKMIAYVNIDNIMLAYRDPEFMAYQEYLAAYEAVQNRVQCGRRYCSTTKRYLGWVPYLAKAGDVVAVFRGAVVPSLLRSTGDGHYLLVGECYIQGIMKGEFYEQASTSEDFSEITIKLK